MHMGELQGGSHRLQLTGEPVVPDPRESLRSLVARTCFANGLPNSFGLLGPLGLIHRNKVNIAEGTDIDDEDLAHAMRLDVQDISSRKYAVLALDHRDFFGLQLHRGRIDNSSRRFSPAGLAAAPFHRAVWELRDLPFCLETWDELRDRCPCPTEDGPTVQRWTRTGSRVSECDRCGNSLADLPRQLVPRDLQADLAILRDLICPVVGQRENLFELLPTEIAATDRSRLFDCLRLMAQVAVGGTIAGLNDNYADAILRWHAACRALMEWPRSMPGQWIRGDVDASVYAYRRDRYLDLAYEKSLPLLGYKARITAERTLHQAPRSPMRSARSLSAQIAGAGAQKARRAASAKCRLERIRRERKIGLRPASEAAKLDPDTLLRAQNEGMLRRFARRHGTKSLPAFDREEAVEFGLRWNGRISCAKAAFGWDISAFGIEQMVAVHALAASAPRFVDEGPHFTAQDLCQFLSNLAGAVSFAQGQWVTLREAMRGINDRSKPWGAVISDMLKGRIRYRLPPNFDQSLPKIEILLDDVGLVRSARFDEHAHCGVNYCPFMVQRDVCELFNLQEVKSKLISFMPSVGAMPKRFDRQIIQRKRTELLSPSELGRSHGLGARAVQKILAGAELHPVGGNFYERTAALNAVRRYLGQGSI